MKRKWIFNEWSMDYLRNCVLVFLSIVICSLQISFLNAQTRPQIGVVKPTGKRFCDTRTCQGTNMINFSTGVNANGSELSPGSIDPFWKLINKPPLSSGNYHASMQIPKIYVIKPYQNNWNNVSNAAIVSPANTPRFPSNNAFRSQPWRSIRSFCLCEGATVSFKGSFAADDEGVLVLKRADGQEVFRIPTTNAFLSPTNFSETHVLSAGAYYLEFEMLNTGGVATGFSIHGKMFAKGNYLINGHSKCCPSSVVSVLKIIENKNTCNGKLDKGEKPGVNWKFSLLNSNGQVVQSGVTDQSGEVVFGGLRAGSYTLVETQQSGFAAKSPSSGRMNIKLADNRIVNYTFFNCPSDKPSSSEFDPCCPPTSDEDLAKQFEFQFSGGMNSSYQVKLVPTPQFKERMQAYADYLHALCPEVTKLQLHFALHNQLNYVDNNMNIYAHFVPGNSSNQMFGGSSFSNNPSLNNNHWYRIHLGMYTVSECGLIDKTCDVPNVDWNIRLEGSQRVGEFKLNGRSQKKVLSRNNTRLN